MNQFDIQMAILGPKVRAQIQEFNDKNIKTIEFNDLNEGGMAEAQMMELYQRVQQGITKAGYRFSERNREEDSYFRSTPAMKGYTLTQPLFALAPNEVVVDKTATLESRIGTALHEFGHAASYPSGTQIPIGPLDWFRPINENHPQVYNEILADVSAYLVAMELGFTSYARRVVAYLGLHRIQPEWIDSNREQIYRNAEYMRKLLGLGQPEAGAALPVAA